MSGAKLKDPSNTLQKAYYDRLNNAVQLNSVIVPVFDTVPARQAPPFIVLNAFPGEENGTKSSYGSIHHAELVIVTQYGADEGGKKDSGNILSAVQQLIVDKNAPLDLGDDFEAVTTTYEFSTSSQVEVETGVQVTRLARFKHLIQQLT